MGEFFIEGGRPLEGALQVQGAKNSVLPILAATILHSGTSVLHNCPHLRQLFSRLQRSSRDSIRSSSLLQA